MLKSKREFTRFDLPLIVKFRPSYGATRFSLGLAKNFSFNGLGLEARDFNFIKNENLEMEVKFPQSGSTVSLLGDVVWKRQVGSSSVAGIKLKVQDNDKQEELIGRIASNRNIPFESVMKKGDTQRSNKAVPEKKITKPVVKRKKAEALPEQLGFVKKFLKNGNCKVTFRLPKEAAPDASNIAIVGDFNDWRQDQDFMTRLKNGDFKATLEIPAGREYRFRYCIDGNRWENDWKADKYLPNDFGCDDSVLSL